ncbi:MAG TPA: hypothetical protein VMD59_21630 [Acidimicrobiales bacterium]|nr:hypothetical protein [Acidimicrobiales bacterium]
MVEAAAEVVTALGSDLGISLMTGGVLVPLAFLLQLLSEARWQ